MSKPLPRDPAVRSLLLNEAKAYLDHHVAMLDELEQLYEGMSRVLEAEYSPAGYRDALAGDPVLLIRAERVKELRRRVPPRLNTAAPYLPDFDEEQLRCGAGARWPNCFRDPQHVPYLAGVEMTQALIQQLLEDERVPDQEVPVGKTAQRSVASQRKRGGSSLTAEYKAMAEAVRRAAEEEPLDLKAIAGKVGCSESYLHRCKRFKGLLQTLQAGSPPPKGAKDPVNGMTEAWDDSN